MERFPKSSDKFIQHEWFIHKFGGTSLANAERIRKIPEILATEKGTYKAIVVSAMSGTTDSLIHLGELASSGNDHYVKTLEELKIRHVNEIEKLLPNTLSQKLNKKLSEDFKIIGEILRGVLLSRSLSSETKDLISGYGELWSAQMLFHLLNSNGIDAIFLDARDIITAHPDDTGIAIDWTETKEQFQKWYEENSKHKWVVITGFIASTIDKVPTTLGRNGSDYSASIFGALFNAQSISIWTDVDGVLSADPKLVPDAVVLDSMSYNEATELAYFGAKVLHPSTMTPAIEYGIPIFIRNTFHLEHPGTKIGNSDANSTHTVRAISVIENMALMTVEGTGMIGIPGVAQRLFGALKDVKISVTLISQASSEQSICFSVTKEKSNLAKTTLEHVFHNELQDKRISSISAVHPCGIVAVVGDAMASHPGTAAKLFGALAQGGVNIRAIAQGASERNISLVIDQVNVQRALRMIHSAFFLSNQTLSVGIIGLGNVGKNLVNQIKEETRRLKEDLNLDLKIRGIANSKKMLLSNEGISLEEWEKEFSKSEIPLDLASFASHIKSDHLPHSVIIDCTADDKISKLYPSWLENRIHIITANKKANTDNIDFYQSIRRSCKKTNTQFLYETNVGAGLPIINTLRELIETGDRIEKIEGILSGTLSYLFNCFDGKRSFSELVKEAQKLGYTEPDPRDDLSGMDLARKLVILCREIGLGVDLSDVEVDNLTQYSDQDFNSMWAQSHQKQEVLRYVGTILPNEVKIKVGIVSYPMNHSFARIQGRDNIISFKTNRYNPEPLIIQGPGAGPVVTAAGVFADLLRLAHSFGGR